MQVEEESGVKQPSSNSNNDRAAILLRIYNDTKDSKASSCVANIMEILEKHDQSIALDVGSALAEIGSMTRNPHVVILNAYSLARHGDNPQKAHEIVTGTLRYIKARIEAADTQVVKNRTAMLRDI